jgi:predicted RNA binding protein YcfA (HicA-like mRNA interferase family)
MKFKLLRSLQEKGWEVDIKKGKILSFKRPDGRHVTAEEMFENHTVPLGIFATIQQNLVLKEQTRGEF